MNTRLQISKQDSTGFSATSARRTKSQTPSPATQEQFEHILQKLEQIEALLADLVAAVQSSR